MSKGQGHRTDLERVTKLVKQKADMRQITEENPETYVKFWRGIVRLDQVLNEPDDRYFKTEVFYYYGEPGSGESSRALAEATASGGAIFYKQRGKWWDGVGVQPVLAPSDCDTLILHRFITGLRDSNATDMLLLHPTTNLAAAIQQCRLYTAYHKELRSTPVPSTATLRLEFRPPNPKVPLPVRFLHHNCGSEYCATFGPKARHCGHNLPHGRPEQGQSSRKPICRKELQQNLEDEGRDNDPGWSHC
ncbi:hypothetical protein SprV_0301344300 [Sparganum proliferum]